jgi:hypothetical protein
VSEEEIERERRKILFSLRVREIWKRERGVFV